MLLVKQRGIVHVTGEGWVGKTMFALTASDDPAKIAVVDCEQSAMQYHESVGFGLYVDLLSQSRSIAPGPETFYALQEIIDTMEPDQFEVLVLENIAVIEASIEAEIEEHPDKYGLSPGQLARMQALKWRPIKDVYRRLMSMMATKANIVIATSHLKSVWVGKQVIPGLFRPQGKDTLEEVCFLKLWLLRGPEWPPPSALVLKSRLGRIDYQKGGAVMANVLPDRMPVATWQAIAGYMNNPYDPSNPKPGEVPSEDEVHLLRGTLSPKHMEVLTLAAQTGGELTDSKDSGSDNKKETAEAAPVEPPKDLPGLLRLVGQKGMKIPEIVNQLGINRITDVTDFPQAARDLGLI
jgi:hypothetical protein